MAVSTINQSNEILLVRNVDSTNRNILTITRNGNLYHVHYERMQDCGNGEACTRIAAEYRPNTAQQAYSFYKQNSGYAPVQGSLGTDGYIKLNATKYNENVAGVFDWIYTK